MLYDWEGNSRSGVTLAMHHRLSGISICVLNGLGKGDEPPMDYRTFTFALTTTNNTHNNNTLICSINTTGRHGGLLDLKICNIYLLHIFIISLFRALSTYYVIWLQYMILVGVLFAVLVAFAVIVFAFKDWVCHLSS